jgi:parallel beta-helix repeat protein
MIKAILSLFAGMLASTAFAAAKTTGIVTYGPYVIPVRPGIYVNSFPGTDLAEQVANAVAALPHSSGIIKIGSGTYPVTSGSIVIPSNITVVCDAGSTTVIQVGSSTFDMPLISVTNASNFGLQDCILDGNRSVNTNSFSLIQVTGSSYGVFSGNTVRNSYANGMYLSGGNTQIDITDNEFYRNGPPLTGGAVGVGLNSGYSGGTANTYFRIERNKVHDNSIGIEIQPSATKTSATTNFDISENQIYSNANDGLVIYSVGLSGGAISNLTVRNNLSYCNGWPANGINFSPNCTPGFLQSGATVSSSGVGIDLNSPSITASAVTGNTTHDNYYEGIDVVLVTQSTVNTNGVVVTWVACPPTTTIGCDPFDTSWLAKQGININGVNYLISSVSSTTQLTLTSSASTQTNVSMFGAGSGHNTMTGNTAYENGHGNNPNSGHGFGDISLGDTWSNNIAYNNGGAGFLDQLASGVSHTGDTAYNNDKGGAFAAGFVCYSCLNFTYTNLTAYDSSVPKKQSYGLTLDSKTNNTQCSSINMPLGGPPLQNQGTTNGACVP